MFSDGSAEAWDLFWAIPEDSIAESATSIIQKAALASQAAPSFTANIEERGGELRDNRPPPPFPKAAVPVADLRVQPADANCADAVQKSRAADDVPANLCTQHSVKAAHGAAGSSDENLISSTNEPTPSVSLPCAPAATGALGSIGSVTSGQALAATTDAGCWNAEALRRLCRNRDPRLVGRQLPGTQPPVLPQVPQQQEQQQREEAQPVAQQQLGCGGAAPREPQQQQQPPLYRSRSTTSSRLLTRLRPAPAPASIPSSIARPAQPLTSVTANLTAVRARRLKRSSTAAAAPGDAAVHASLLNASSGDDHEIDNDSGWADGRPKQDKQPAARRRRQRQAHSSGAPPPLPPLQRGRFDFRTTRRQRSAARAEGSGPVEAAAGEASRSKQEHGSQEVGASSGGDVSSDGSCGSGGEGSGGGCRRCRETGARGLGESAVAAVVAATRGAGVAAGQQEPQRSCPHCNAANGPGTTATATNANNLGNSGSTRDRLEPSSSRSHSSSTPVSASTSAPPSLEHELREWRSVRARGLRKSPESLLRHGLLAELAERCPTSVLALEEMPGLQKSWVRQFGQEVMDVCRNHMHVCATAAAAAAAAAAAMHASRGKATVAAAAVEVAVEAEDNVMQEQEGRGAGHVAAAAAAAVPGVATLVVIENDGKMETEEVEAPDHDVVDDVEQAEEAAMAPKKRLRVAAAQQHASPFSEGAAAAQPLAAGAGGATSSYHPPPSPMAAATAGAARATASADTSLRAAARAALYGMERAASGATSDSPGGASTLPAPSHAAAAKPAVKRKHSVGGPDAAGSKAPRKPLTASAAVEAAAVPPAAGGWVPPPEGCRVRTGSQLAYAHTPAVRLLRVGGLLGLLAEAGRTAEPFFAAGDGGGAAAAAADGSVSGSGSVPRPPETAAATSSAAMQPGVLVGTEGNAEQLVVQPGRGAAVAAAAAAAAAAPPPESAFVLPAAAVTAAAAVHSLGRYSGRDHMQQLRGLVYAAMPAWEVKRVLACRELAPAEQVGAVLRIDPRVGREEVRVAFRRLSLLVHPDKNRSQGAAEAFSMVSMAAKRLLGNGS